MLCILIVTLLTAGTLLGYGNIEDAFADSNAAGVEEALFNSFTAYGFPTTPMEEGRFNFKVVPSYWTFDGESKVVYTNEKDKLSGGGFAISGTYALNNHWGITGIAVYYAGSGTGPLHNAGKPGQLPPGRIGSQLQCGIPACPPDPPVPSTNQNVNGVAGTLGITYDPFSDPEGFRLPMFIGTGFFHFVREQKTDNYTALYNNCVAGAGPCATQPGGLVFSPTRSHVKLDQDLLTISAGIAPQFNTGLIRWIPFGMVTGIYRNDRSAENQQTNLATGQATTVRSSKSQDGAVTYSAGLAALYRPWNLGFTYVPGFVSQGASLYTLTWSKTF